MIHLVHTYYILKEKVCRSSFRTVEVVPYPTLVYVDFPLDDCFRSFYYHHTHLIRQRHGAHHHTHLLVD